MNLKEMLRVRMDELEGNVPLTEWDSLFAEKVDDEEDESKEKEEEKEDKEEKDDDKKSKESDSSPEEDTPAEDDDQPSEDDSIADAMSSDDSGSSGEEETPPEVDTEDEVDSTQAMEELGQKIHLSKPEVEIMDSLIESETDAISDYSKALNETKNKYVRKLLTEILTDESKHLAQLKYLKSLGTDSDYIPKDKEAIDELHDTLESLIQDLL